MDLLRQQPRLPNNLVARVAPSPIDPKLGQRVVKICVMVRSRLQEFVSQLEVRIQDRDGSGLEISSASRGWISSGRYRAAFNT